MSNELVINYNTLSRLTPMSYEPPITITEQEWLEDGEFIKRIDKLNKFAKGDYILFGQKIFGEMYSQAVDEFEWGDYNYLSKLVWVARNVPPHVRHYNLTWTHHHHVASMTEQEQVEWLDAAEANEWTARELKEEIKESRMIIDTTDAVMSKGITGKDYLLSIAGSMESEAADEPPYANDALYTDDVPSADNFWLTNGYQPSAAVFVHCPGCDEDTRMPGAIIAAGTRDWQCANCGVVWRVTATFEQVGGVG